MLIPLLFAAVTDWREGKIRNWQCALALCIGFTLALARGEGAMGIVRIFARVVGTCLVFFVFFLCRMLGAGDVKMMAVCVGALGAGRGALMIFLSFLGAAAEAAYRLIKNKTLWARISLLAEFTLQIVREKRTDCYPAWETMHLGPWLLFGCAALLLAGGR